LRKSFFPSKIRVEPEEQEKKGKEEGESKEIYIKYAVARQID